MKCQNKPEMRRKPITQKDAVVDALRGRDHKSVEEKAKTPIVFPKPARACDEEIRSGDTLVKGSLAICSLDGKVDGGGGGGIELFFDKNEVADSWDDSTPSPFFGARLAKAELLVRANAGSNVQSSHRSSVALVRP
jgi:hypothetical protein